MKNVSTEPLSDIEIAEQASYVHPNSSENQRVFSQGAKWYRDHYAHAPQPQGLTDAEIRDIAIAYDLYNVHQKLGWKGYGNGVEDGLRYYRDRKFPGDMQSRDHYAQPSGWISVKERLPEDGQRVLVVTNDTANYKPVTFGEYWADTDSWTVCDFMDSMMDAKVNHWQPLPAPPGGE